jgi:ribose 5-phosphate isomerase RpiB
MRIAVLNEISAVDKNKDIMDALAGRGHEIFNLGMADAKDTPQLLYIHTGFLAAFLLALGKVDLVVGGCGTGQGFLNAVMQYPGVFCGHILTPLDAWLFTQINDGNCVSLALNQGYGWAGNVNLKFIFDRLFEPERGGGYPPHRREAQTQGREMLQRISGATHRTFADIISGLADEVLLPAVRFPRFRDFLPLASIEDEQMRKNLEKRIDGAESRRP